MDILVPCLKAGFHILIEKIILFNRAPDIHSQLACDELSRFEATPTPTRNINALFQNNLW